MKRSFLLIIGLLLGITSLQAQKVQYISTDDIKAMVARKSDTLFVINFWASWCKPCVREMPHFKALQEELKGEKIDFYFISMNGRPEEAQAFMDKKGYKHDMYWLSDENSDYYLPAIHESWTSDLPATLFIKPGDGIYDFYQKEYSEEELREKVMGYLK